MKVKKTHCLSCWSAAIKPSICSSSFHFASALISSILSGYFFHRTNLSCIYVKQQLSWLLIPLAKNPKIHRLNINYNHYNLQFSRIMIIVIISDENMLIQKVRSILNEQQPNFFSHLGFLSQIFQIHRAAVERGGYFYHSHPFHRYLDISQAITGESSPLRIASSRTGNGNLCFPSASRQPLTYATL